jgi:hypothetical protein
MWLDNHGSSVAATQEQHHGAMLQPRTLLVIKTSEETDGDLFQPRHAIVGISGMCAVPIGTQDSTRIAELFYEMVVEMDVQNLNRSRGARRNALSAAGNVRATGRDPGTNNQSTENKHGAKNHSGADSAAHFAAKDQPGASPRLVTEGQSGIESELGAEGQSGAQNQYAITTRDQSGTATQDQSGA